MAKCDVPRWSNWSKSWWSVFGDEKKEMPQFINEDWAVIRQAVYYGWTRGGVFLLFSTGCDDVLNQPYIRRRQVYRYARRVCAHFDGTCDGDVWQLILKFYSDVWDLAETEILTFLTHRSGRKSCGVIAVYKSNRLAVRAKTREVKPDRRSTMMSPLEEDPRGVMSVLKHTWPIPE